MAQKTAKTVRDVLEWIETNGHHFASACEEPGFFILKGHGCKLRIPNKIQVQTRGLVKPGKHFDTRMYRATAKGRSILRNANA